MDDDARWREVLRGLSETFRHRTVTSREVEDYLSAAAGRDLNRVFDQYLRHSDVPVLEYALTAGMLRYRWRADVQGFDLPVRVTLGPGRYGWIELETNV